EKNYIEMGPPERTVITTCAYCGVGCNFKVELKGDDVVRMVPWKDGKANHGHSCVKGRFAWGYANHQDRILKPMVRDKITDPWRERCSATTTPTPARASAIRRPDTASARRSAPPPARRISIRSRKATSFSSSAPTRRTRIRCSPRG